MVESSKKILNSSLALFILGLIAGLIWRLELEYHGWDGLIWISYFHWAIPFGVFLFISWVLLTIQFFHFHLFSRSKILKIVASLVICSVIFYFITLYACIFIVYSGPSAFIFFMQLGIFRDPIAGLLYLALLSLPFFLYTLARFLGFLTNFWNLIVSTIVYVSAPTVSIFLIKITNYPSEADFIHTIKTGFIVPFLFLAFGVIFLPIFKSKNRQFE